MILATSSGWAADAGPMPDDVATVCAGVDPACLESPSLEALRAELWRATGGGRRLDQWDGGHLVRVATKAGLPIPRGVAGLPAPTARNWVRAVIACLEGGDVARACVGEPNVQLVPARGLGNPKPLAAPPAAPRMPVAAARSAAPDLPASDAAVVEGFRVRFPGFPDVLSAAARAAVDRWVERNGRPFPGLEEPAPAPSPAAEVATRPAAAGGGEERQAPVEPTATPVALDLEVQRLAREVYDQIGANYPQRRLRESLLRLLAMLGIEGAAA